MDELTRAATGADNVLPHLIAAAKARATLGELSDALRAVYGEHRELVTV
jgi:methylmalonyl-CoA mutase N-terminal domain/subunit